MSPKRNSAAALLSAMSLGGLAVSGAVPQHAAAQEEAARDRERIVVTARRRAEELIEVPASITAFGADEIEAADITTARDYVTLTPNVTLVETQNAGTAFLTIRGISQARNSEPSVSVIIDGVQQTNPSQFTQELVDIARIEVVRGPQGAIYGRNAIGGAINITSRLPTDDWEGRLEADFDNGFGYTLTARAGGPVLDRLGFSGGLIYRDTEGYLDNELLDEKADPLTEFAGRGRLFFEAGDNLTVDLRGSFDQLDGRALYYVIGPDVNDTSIPIRVNNQGTNDRDIYGVSLQVEHQGMSGTFTSTTAWDSLEEILTGDQFDFKPREESFFFNCTFAPFPFCGTDWNQSQFLDTDSFSQELRFVSPAERRIRYIAGVYVVKTDRFISTGNMIDTGNGVFPVRETPSTNPLNPQVTFLADKQDNLAWAAFGDLTFDFGEDWELSLAARYDRDKREQTTLTPPEFLVALPQATSGEVRTETFDAMQPKVTLRWSPQDDLTVYASYSRGFRSGGFNQSGVADAAQAAGIVGVGDIFRPETVDAYEAGIKGETLNGGLSFDAAAFFTQSKDSYFFVFLASNSTQNLGNVDEVEYKGFELNGAARLNDELSLNVGVGVTESEITEFADPAAIGNKAPLVSDYTVNLGLQYLARLYRLRGLADTGWSLRARADFRRIGDTYWEPFNTTVRDPVDLLDLRIGLESDELALTAWGKNVLNEDYNAEFSPGGFLFKALPLQYGVELSYRF